jgi:hypothetical protein
MKRKDIAIHYLTSWFFVDLMGTIPFELILSYEYLDGNTKESRKSLKILKYFKLPKLLRLSRVMKILKQYGKFFAIVSLCFCFVFACHFFACALIWEYDPCQLFYENSLLDPPQELDEILTDFCADPSLLYFNVHAGVNAMMLGLENVQNHRQYFPYTERYGTGAFDVAFKWLVDVTGMGFVAFLFANAVLLVSSRTSSAREFAFKMERINRDMNYYSVPEHLQHKVKKYYDYMWHHQKNAGDLFLLSDPGLSNSLKASLALFLYKELISNVPFFKGCSDDLLGKVR